MSDSHASHSSSSSSHAAGHSHAPADFGKAFAIGTALNLAFVAVEGGAGLWTGSVALLADAGHNLSDVLGLLIAWGGAELAKRPPSERFTYGLRGSSILAAIANGLLLMVAVGMITLQAIQRFGDPQPIPGVTVMIVAGVGIAVNGATAMLFARGRKGDVNIRGAYLHMAADAAVSAGVVVAGALILFTGARWIDPAVSLLIVVVILWSTWGLLKESVVMALSAVPRAIDPSAVRQLLEEQEGVARVHDLHIWPMSTTEAALTAHLVMPGGHPGDQFLLRMQRTLAQDHGIEHVTLQIEIDENVPCLLHSDNCA